MELKFEKRYAVIGPNEDGDATEWGRIKKPRDTSLWGFVGNKHGYTNAEMLRAVADELDRLNTEEL